MTAQDFTLLDELAAQDWLPSKALARQLVIEAVNRAADDHAGRVTAAWVRPHLPRWALGPQVGAVMSVLTKRGLLVRVPGAVHESENTGQRNGTRLMPLYTRTREITLEDLP